jgi:hypothetical protein
MKESRPEALEVYIPQSANKERSNNSWNVDAPEQT